MREGVIGVDVCPPPPNLTVRDHALPAPMTDSPPPRSPAAPVPRSFSEYVRSFGPGLVIVLTWLGAGDVVDMGVAGSHYGYSLMWILVVALVMRFLFVSLIARYQLCNQHGEGVLDGLARLHRWYAPVLFFAAILMGHVYGAYMTKGAGETLANVFGMGQPWQWAVLCNGAGLALVFRPAFRRLEIVFLIFLGVLSVSFIGCALWVGFDPAGVLKGLVSFEIPEERGEFNPLLVTVAMIGAVGGSLMNLVYPYFLEAKGWRGPQYRRVQLYDFALGVAVMIVLNLAVWTLAAELLFPYPDDQTLRLEDLTGLLGNVLGPAGRILFYAGIFSAVYTSLIGHAAGLGCLGSHAWLRWRAGRGEITKDYRTHPCYRWIAVSCLVTPLVWMLPGTPDFVTLTLVSNSAQVVLLPMLAGGLWWITASSRHIGATYRNRWWENVLMAGLFLLALYGAVGAVVATKQFLLGS